MDNFAFVIHPLDPKQDVARQYPLLARILPTKLIHFFSRLWPPLYISHITGIRSEATGKEIEGWLVACPLTAQQIMSLPHQTAYHKIIQTGLLAQKLGANILGLGAFTSAVGDGGVTVAQHLDFAVTTGHSLTISVVVEALVKAAHRQGMQPESSTAAVVGATGSIGAICVKLLAPMVKGIILIGRRKDRLAQVREQIMAAGARRVRTSTQIADIHKAHMVLSASNATEPIIHPEHLKHGAAVCDVALPPDVSPRTLRERKDVLVVSGGVVNVPGAVDFGFNFGLPPGKAYACMAEAMILALEGRYENYSLGKQIQIERVREITKLAHKHGFRL